MRLLQSFVYAIIILFPHLAFSEDLGLMRLSLIQGEVLVMTQDNGDWTPATINMPLNEGDRIWVPEGGRMEIQVRGGASVRAVENSSLDVLIVNADSAQFYMDHGHAYINNRQGDIRTVQVDMPRASFRCYDNSIMMLDAFETGATTVQVLNGFVDAENREGKTRVAAGSALTIKEDGSAELAPIGTPDEWDRWNMDRDKQLADWGESSRYLPDALHEYASDFNQHGRWLYIGDYGYVWSPTVTSAAWAPYREGRWKWVRSHYVWISYEPWGWVPYHYGRWASVTGTGWCWVPPALDEVYWGPGYVGWITTPEYIGWVPLAPDEVYYDYGNYGPASVNIADININTVVMKEHRNAQVRNGVTVVNRDTFGTATPIFLKLRKNPFLQQRFTFIPPMAKPDPLITLKNTIGAPDRNQPPERIRKLKPQEIKAHRRLVKEHDASVFRPEHPNPLALKRVKQPKKIIRKIKPMEHQE